ncbi:8456_t:CDS:10, partial [Acaulospora morrowiae]
LLQASSGKSTADDPFQGVHAVLVIVGDISEENPYQKSTALQQWLLGYEFTDTLILILQDKIHFVVKEKRADVLEKLKQGGQVQIEIHKRTKDASHNQKIFESIISKITEGEKKRIGLLLKEKISGKFVDEWKAVYNKHEKDFEEVDIASGIAAALAVKDEDELKTMRTASKISISMMNRFIYLVTSMIDEEKEITHEQLAEDVENILYSKEDKWLSSQKSMQDVDFERTDICYAPIIQSGGEYDFRTSAQSNTSLLHEGTILFSLGVRYKSYCSNIGRTILMNPNKDQEKTYEFLLEIQRRILEWIKDGVKICDVYTKATRYIKTKRPDLLDKFVKNLGHGTGMVLNLFIGFTDLENPKATDEKSKIYALWLIDTVRVGGESVQVLTESNRSFNSICFSFKDANESKRPAKAVETKR